MRDRSPGTADTVDTAAEQLTSALPDLLPPEPGRPGLETDRLQPETELPETETELPEPDLLPPETELRETEPLPPETELPETDLLPPETDETGPGPAPGPSRGPKVTLGWIEHARSYLRAPGSGSGSGSGSGPGPQRRGGRALRRGGIALAWAVGAAAVFLLFLRIAPEKVVESDGANNALQAWDLLHGNPLLHGWVIGDATYYTFELPVIAVVEIFFGLHNMSMYVAEALIYLMIAAAASAIAVTSSYGMSRALRAALVVAMLAAPALVASDMWIPLGEPDHAGTTIFLLVSCLLIDRTVVRRFTALPICLFLCVFLAAGQIGDVTVRYVAVPAIVLVCAYRGLAARQLRTWDAANMLAAAASVPLSLAVRKIMLSAGAYVMVSPKTRIAPVSEWGHNAAIAWGSIRMLYGAQPGPGVGPIGTVAIFGYAFMLATAIGMVRVLWRWRTARGSEQVLLVVMAVNIAVYIVSTLPAPNAPHDIIAVLPSGAVLAARALVPERITSRVTGLVAAGLALAVAVVPLTAAATKPPQAASLNVLASWLQAHGLTYGVGGYWDGSAVSVVTSNHVQIRAVHLVSLGYQAHMGNLEAAATTPGLAFYPWETNASWFDPAGHYANFAVINLAATDLLSPAAARIFGKPVSTHIIGSWEVLVYQQNLLTDLAQAPLPPTS